MKERDTLATQIGILGSQMVGVLEEIKSLRSDMREILDRHNGRLALLELANAERKGEGKVHGAIWGAIISIIIGAGSKLFHL